MAGAQAGHVKSCNALVCSVTLCRTQQWVKNFNTSIFNLLNAPGHKLGILTYLIHLSIP